MYNPTFETDENGVVRGWGLYPEYEEEAEFRAPWILERSYHGGFALLPPRSTVIVDEGYGFTFKRGQKLILSVDEYLEDVFVRMVLDFYLFSGSGERVYGTYTYKNGYNYTLDFDWEDEYEFSDVRLALHNSLDSPSRIGKLSVEEVAS